MAFKSVVNDAFFEDVMQALVKVEHVQGELSFALLSSPSSQPSQWSLTLAAPWIDGMSPLRAGAKLRAFLHDAIRLRNKLGEVLIRSTDDSLVRSFLSTLDIPQIGTAYRVTGLELDLFNMDEAVCLLARPLVPQAQALSA